MASSYRVAITGGAGSGKSTAAQLFAECGALVVDADALAHELMEPGQAVNSELRAAFGSDIFDDEGRIIRPALRTLVLHDSVARATLEELLHPPIRALLKARSAQANPYAVLVIPLLAETGRPDFVNRVLVIEVKPALQKQRLLNRGLSRTEIDALCAIQATPSTRATFAQDVIINNGSKQDLALAVEDHHKRYLVLSRQP